MPKANLNGTELHYRDGGSGKDVVLLLHAFPLHSGMWTRQIASLGKRHRIIAPDYRGLGKSGVSTEASTMELLAQDVRALLQHVRVERAAVVGLSMGGYLAFELYRQAPALFRGLVLCDTRAGADNDEGMATREKFAKAALEKGLTWVADEMVPKLLRPQPDPATVKEVRALVAEGTPVGVAAAQRGMARRPDSVPTLSKITCPAVMIFGEDDQLTAFAEAQRMGNTIRGSRIVRVPGAGHLSNLENPGAFNAALMGFCAALPA